MKSKIAVVTAFSERCSSLVKQFLVSCHLSASKYIELADFHYFVYECNWIGEHSSLKIDEITRKPQAEFLRPFYEFSKPIQINNELLLPNCEFTQINASELNSIYSWLPDIITYQDFCDKYINEFDYVLFCHDDIIINDKKNLFSSLIATAERNSEIAVIGETHLECYGYISARIYPHFVFIKTSKFLEYKLSWANGYRIFDNSLKSRDPYNDGGAGLLASIYQNNVKPWALYTNMEKNLFHHLRPANISVGIETSIINSGYTEEILSLFDHAEKYVACNLWK